MIDLKPPYGGDGRLCPLVVTGTPRSGTKFICTALRNAGKHIKHESAGGEDGLVDWMWLFRERNPDRVDRLILQVREPVACIRSIAIHPDKIHDWLCAVVPINKHDSPIKRAAQFYLYWNSLLLSMCDDWYQLEDRIECMRCLSPFGLKEWHLDGADQNRNEGPAHALGGLIDLVGEIDKFTRAGLMRLAETLGYE